MTMRPLLLILGLAALACGGAGPGSTEGSKSEPSPGASTPDEGGRKAKRKAGGGSGGGSSGGGSAPQPLAGKSLAQICKDDALLLIKEDVDQLMKKGFHQLCCENGGPLQGDDVCSLDWPFNDVPPCEVWDELRNDIYAKYGYPFKEEKWQRRYASDPSYKRREDFDASWLSPAASRNVETLKGYKSRTFSCSP
jgi:hypothetical protein